MVKPFPQVPQQDLRDIDLLYNHGYIGENTTVYTGNSHETISLSIQWMQIESELKSIYCEVS